MARKLKSDKVLFLATLLLVCSSVVMVYSASAVLAMNRFNQPYFFLTKQAMWAAMGLAAMSIAMRFDYRNYREPAFIWTALGVVVFALVAVLFSAPINGSRRWFGVGRLRRAAIRAREAERHRFHSGASGAPDGSHRRHSVRPGAHRHGRRRTCRTYSARARSRNRHDAAGDCGGDGVCGRAQLSIRRRRDSRRSSGRVLHPDERGLSPPAAHGVLGPMERSARRRLSGHPVADRGGIRAG